MKGDIDLDTIQEQINNVKAKSQSDDFLEKKSAVGEQHSQRSMTAEDVIDERHNADLQTLQNDADFKKLSMNIALRELRAKLEKNALDVLNEEQKNQLSAYVLKKEKERLDYRVKYERNIDREEVKAEVYRRKLEMAKKRYGHLYQQELVETTDENGQKTTEIRYKNFTTSKWINRYKEFVEWYNNLAKTTQKAILTTAKLLLIVLGVGICGHIIYSVIAALINNGVLNIAIG